MIDIHSHILFSVDDGSKSLEQSIEYLKEIKEIGMNKVVCTPHISHDNPEKMNKIRENFEVLKAEALKLGIELYLGNEIMCRSNTLELLQNNKVNTINKTKYILVEFKRGEKRSIDNISDILNEFIDNGYYPILAHPELYVNLRNINNYRRLKEEGVLLQIDGTSLLPKKSGLKTYLFAKKLIKERLVDFVASDSHCTKLRDYKSMLDAYNKVKKIDSDYADIIFHENQLEIIGSID